MAINKNGTNTDNYFSRKSVGSVFHKSVKPGDYPCTQVELEAFEKAGSVPGQEWRELLRRSEAALA